MAELTIHAADVRTQPVADAQALPGWAREVLAFVVRAGEAGQEVRLDARVETLTPAEVADRLGISRATVSRRIAAGEISTIKVGNRHRIPLAEFDRYRRELHRQVAEHYADDVEADLFG